MLFLCGWKVANNLSHICLPDSPRESMSSGGSSWRPGSRLRAGWACPGHAWPNKPLGTPVLLQGSQLSVRRRQVTYQQEAPGGEAPAAAAGAPAPVPAPLGASLFAELPDPHALTDVAPATAALLPPECGFPTDPFAGAGDVQVGSCGVACCQAAGARLLALSEALAWQQQGRGCAAPKPPGHVQPTSGYALYTTAATGAFSPPQRCS